MTIRKDERAFGILCLDFDGVIHSYESGWQGASIVVDKPVPGAFKFILEALQHFRVAIFSSRSNQPGGLKAMQDWFALHAQAEIDDEDEAYGVVESVEWVAEKPPAFVTIDDRAITFMGKWPSIETLKNFKTWQQLKAGNPVIDGVPRRARIDLFTPEERAIFDAMTMIEMLGAHPLLTGAVVLLGAARMKLADWVDLQLEVKGETE